MQSGMIAGPISNKKLMEFSPMEKIAKMLDFYCPGLIKNILDIVENQEIDVLNENYELHITDTSKHQHLIEYFWAIAKKGNIYELMFLFDYRLYINFFLQYPIITGRKMDENATCTAILKEYEQMEMTGNVEQVTAEDEYYFIYYGDMLEEVADIEKEIAKYQAEEDFK